LQKFADFRIIQAFFDVSIVPAKVSYLLGEIVETPFHSLEGSAFY
jgi:hypothetical protein